MKLPNLLLGALLGVALAAAPAPPSGIVVANMDSSVAPGNDFFSYANGGWVARAVIPADRASVSAFSRLSDISDRRTSTLIEGVAKSQPAPGSDARKIADLYNAYMETAAIDRCGLAPLRARLAAIAAIRTRTDLARVLGESLRADVDALNNTNFHTSNLLGMCGAGLPRFPPLHRLFVAGRPRAAQWLATFCLGRSRDARTVGITRLEGALRFPASPPRCNRTRRARDAR